MKQIVISIPLFLIISINFCLGQNRTLLETFVVETAKYNKHDSTSYYKRNKTKLSLYHIEESDSLLFSFGDEAGKLITKQGEIFDLRAKLYDKTDNAHQAEFITFRWNYQNPGSANKETAFVQIWRVYKSRGVTFECWILFRDGDIVDLEGIIDRPVHNTLESYHINPSMFTKEIE